MMEPGGGLMVVPVRLKSEDLSFRALLCLVRTGSSPVDNPVSYNYCKNNNGTLSLFNISCC
jgi:hypothetical protein